MKGILGVSTEATDEPLVPGSELMSQRKRTSQQLIQTHRIARGLIPMDIVSNGWLKRDACNPRIPLDNHFLSRAFRGKTTRCRSARRRFIELRFDMVQKSAIETHHIIVEFLSRETSRQ